MLVEEFGEEELGEMRDDMQEAYQEAKAKILRYHRNIRIERFSLFASPILTILAVMVVGFTFWAKL